MSKIARKTAKIFGSTANANQIAKYGSLAASSPVLYSGSTADPANIQALANWTDGWFDAVEGASSPAIEDMNGFCFVDSYQIAYLLQAGVAEWDSATTYYIGSIVNDGAGNIYSSLVDSNLNKALSNTFYWQNPNNAALAKLAVNNWTRSNASEENEWVDVVFAGGQFIAIAVNGTHRIMTSPDGVTWTNRTQAESNNLTSVAYGASTYALVSSDGTHRVQTSPDGVTWTNRTAASASIWSSITFGNSLFVAVGTGAALSNAIMTSPDGATWTNRTSVGSRFLISVAYSSSLGLFVAVSSDGIIITSPDGITWTQRTTPVGVSYLRGLIFGGGQFLAIVSDGGTPNNKLISSVDGISWTVVTLTRTQIYDRIAYGNGLFVMTDESQSGFVAASLDGKTWSNAYQCAAGVTQPSSVAYGVGVFVGITFGDTNPKVFTTLRYDNFS